MSVTICPKTMTAAERIKGIDILTTTLQIPHYPHNSDSLGKFK